MKTNMSNSLRYAFFGALGLLHVLPAGAAQPGSPALSAPMKAAAGGSEWVSMFNGRDLSEWDVEPGYWSVQNGVLVGNRDAGAPPTPPGHTYAVWRGGELGDFELRAMFRRVAGNSGIEYRAVRVGHDPNKPRWWTLRGCQADIGGGAVGVGTLYAQVGAGVRAGQFVVAQGERRPWNRQIGAVGPTPADPAGISGDPKLVAACCDRKGWNEYTIVARNRHILQRVNGCLTAEVIDNTSEAPSKGLVGLQIHGGQGKFREEFKDIRVRQFQVDFGQPELLWANLSGSRENVRSEGKYDNFVLRFQFRRQGTGQTGVLLRLAEGPQAAAKGIGIYGQRDDFDQVRFLGSFSGKPTSNPATTAPRKLPEGLWNECEITLNQGRLEVAVNDVLRAAATECEVLAGGIGFTPPGNAGECRNVVLIPIISRR